MAQVTIEPTVWSRVRRMAFDRGVTASSLVREALDLWLAEQETAASPRADQLRVDTAASSTPHVGSVPAPAPAPKPGANGRAPATGGAMPGPLRDLTGPLPWDAPAAVPAKPVAPGQGIAGGVASGPVLVGVDLASGPDSTAVLARTPSEIVVAKDAGPAKMIANPGDVAKRVEEVMAAKARPVTPVPKPSAKPRSRR